MLSTLGNRNFALLWLGGVISLAGDWVLNIGLPIYVFLLTHSVLVLSIALLAVSVPNILLGSVAGVFVDRWDRRRTLIVTNLLLALGLVPLLLVRTADRVWIVYAVAFVESCLEQFSVPAKNALLPTLVGEEHLVPANSLNSVSSNLARLVGPALGGVIAGVFGLLGIVVGDAVSFLFAAVLVSLIVAPHSAQDKESSLVAAEASAFARVWRDWAAGLRLIRAEQTLFVLLTAVSITALGEGVMGVLYPVFVNRVLHGGAPEIGQLMSAQAVGGLLGGVLVGMLGSRVLSRWAIGLCAMAFGLVDLVIFNIPAIFPYFWLQIALFIVVGVPGIGMLAGFQSLVQARAPDAYRGRVFGALGTTMGLLGLIGTLTAGTVTDHLGVVTVLSIQGAGYVVAGLVLLAFLPHRRTGATSAAVLSPTEHAPVVHEV
jgi:MFS family permease